VPIRTLGLAVTKASEPFSRLKPLVNVANAEEVVALPVASLADTSRKELDAVPIIVEFVDIVGTNIETIPVTLVPGGQ